MVTARHLQNIFTIFLFYLLIYRFVYFLSYLNKICSVTIPLVTFYV